MIIRKKRERNILMVGVQALDAVVYIPSYHSNFLYCSAGVFSYMDVKIKFIRLHPDDSFYYLGVFL